MELFLVRRAVERLRAGLFDPVAVDRLTMEEEAVTRSFLKGLKALEEGQSSYLCLCGSYGQGKSHNMNYLRQKALASGYAVSLLQLDVREVPFYQFPVVYQSLMKNLSLPTGDSLAASWKKSALTSEALEGMPHRFRMILEAMKAKEQIGPVVRQAKRDFKPKDFDYWLEEALVGHDLSLSHLKQIFKIRGVQGGRKDPLICRGHTPYIQMVQSLGNLLHLLGYKGLVLFFDEAESIAQGRLNARIKSYGLLNQFFQYSGFIYPVFAFTDSFFDKVRDEVYQGEATRFPQNYAELWKDLQIIRLQDSPAARWEVLQDRLIALYAEAYQMDLAGNTPIIKQQMRDLLEKLKAQETRCKLKALIYHLDIVCIRTAS